MPPRVKQSWRGIFVSPGLASQLSNNIMIKLIKMTIIIIMIMIMIMIMMIIMITMSTWGQVCYCCCTWVWEWGAGGVVGGDFWDKISREDDGGEGIWGRRSRESCSAKLCSSSTHCQRFPFTLEIDRTTIRGERNLENHFSSLSLYNHQISPWSHQDFKYLDIMDILWICERYFEQVSY